MGDAESEHFVEAASIFFQTKKGLKFVFDVCYINKDSNDKNRNVNISSLGDIS